MKAKVLAEDRYRILAVVEDDACPAEDFLILSDNYERSRQGLISMLQAVAELGLGEVSSKWFHEASKAQKIYEFIKGDLRLFFFKGQGRDIAVCTCGVVKKGQKADAAVVGRAASLRNEYMAAAQSGNLEIICDD